MLSFVNLKNFCNSYDPYKGIKVNNQGQHFGYTTFKFQNRSSPQLVAKRKHDILMTRLQSQTAIALVRHALQWVRKGEYKNMQASRSNAKAHILTESSGCLCTCWGGYPIFLHFLGKFKLSGRDSLDASAQWLWWTYI